MAVYLHLFGLNIPSYGLMIFFGVFIANVCAVLVIRKNKMPVDDMILLEAYGFGVGYLGSKLLYFLVSFGDIEWSRILDMEYLNSIMSAGFVFYGGAIFGLLMCILAGKFHKINSFAYLKKVIFCLPLAHAFGRIGCFMAGCCYGRPYDGIFAVTYPSSSFAPSGIPLFPVQLFEAFFLLLISLIVFITYYKFKVDHPIEIYIILYSTLRFILEYLRFDSYRGIYAGVSTSQWISIVLFVGAILYWIFLSKKVNSKYNT